MERKQSGKYRDDIARMLANPEFAIRRYRKKTTKKVVVKDTHIIKRIK